MAKRYRATSSVRMTNGILTTLARLGLAGKRVSVLTTIGRRTGRTRSVPVTALELDGARYLVAPYGTTGWVHNIRASGTARLHTRGKDEQIAVTELRDEEGARVLQRYWMKVRVVRPYFDVTDATDLAAFVSELPRHPVFRIEN